MVATQNIKLMLKKLFLVVHVQMEINARGPQCEDKLWVVPVRLLLKILTILVLEWLNF